MKKSIVIILLMALIIWLLPIKRTLNEKLFDIKKYIVDERVAILCVSENTTDVQFKIIDSAGIEQCPHYIKSLRGNTPEYALKYQIDDYYDEVQFLFIGYFENKIEDLKESYDFIVDEWYTVGKIRRNFSVLPYPSYGFNIFEMEMTNMPFH